MSATVSARAPRTTRKAAETATATDAAPDAGAAPAVDTAPADAYPGALPPAETTVADVSEQTGMPADQIARQVAETVNATLQSAVQDTPAPSVSAEEVVKTQKACYERATGRAATLATAENRTILDMARDLQEAIDAFKPLFPKSDWWRERADTIDDFGRFYRRRMNGRSAEPYKWLMCLAVFNLGSEESRATLLTGRSGRPFPIATIDAIGDWVIYNKADDTYCAPCARLTA